MQLKKKARSLELTVKQRMLVYHKVAGRTNREAAILAGYSKNTPSEAAYEVLNKPHIKAYLEKCVKEAAAKLGIGPDYILGSLKKVADECLEGKATREGFLNASGAVSAINEINKILGHHSPEKTENTHSLGNIEPVLQAIDNAMKEE